MGGRAVPVCLFEELRVVGLQLEGVQADHLQLADELHHQAALTLRQQRLLHRALAVHAALARLQVRQGSLRGLPEEITNAPD